MTADLSVLIPARQEMFLAQTIANVLAQARGDLQVVAVCDGAWADPPIHDDPRVLIIYLPESIGQRAATNLAARAASGRYVMKLDAHCALAEGFDVELVQTGDALGHDVSQIPAMINLHAFNWRCRACRRETYQGPEPRTCEQRLSAQGEPASELAVNPPPCGARAGFDRVLIWAPRRRRAKGNGSEGEGGVARTEFWRFDHDLHFQYRGPVIRGQEQDKIADVMSSVGACFVMRRERFLELGGLDEDHGSWGQFGTEIAGKSWLSGGRQVVNRRTWFAHLFRTTGSFSFPYPIAGAAQEYARQYSQNLWFGNFWPQQTRPLSWLIDYFWPIRGWSDPDGAERLAFVRERGKAFRSSQGETVWKPPSNATPPDALRAYPQLSSSTPETASAPDAAKTCQGAGRSSARPAAAPAATPVRVSKTMASRGSGAASPAATSSGLLYYSDNRGDSRILAAARQQIVRAAPPEWPLVSVTLAPLAFGHNLVLPLTRGYVTMFRQILAGLEALDTDLVWFLEHDVAYHPSHFDFMPPQRDRYWYNQHTWKVDAATGRALHYRCCQTSGLCGDRRLLLEHYRRRLAAVETNGGYQRHMGFEPGTNRWARGLDGIGFESWMSQWPNVDIRHGRNLTKSRWRRDEFRNKNSCLGWTEADDVPGWGVTAGRFDAWLTTMLEEPTLVPLMGRS